MPLDQRAVTLAFVEKQQSRARAAELAGAAGANHSGVVARSAQHAPAARRKRVLNRGYQTELAHHRGTVITSIHPHSATLAAISVRSPASAASGSSQSAYQ